MCREALGLLDVYSNNVATGFPPLATYDIRAFFVRGFTKSAANMV